jgi:FkbM family methyltransferase
MFSASVIIPVHNGEAVLADQLDALASQHTSLSFETIIVLNCCTDRTLSIASGFGERLTLRVIVADDKASAAYARNAGAAEASSDNFLFCDADDRVGAAWVEAMLNGLLAADFVGGCPELDGEGVPAWVRERIYRNVDGPRLNLYDGRILYPISASLGCSRTAFEAVGGFDETFPGAAGEEYDLALRLLRQGRRVGLAKDATYLYRPRHGLRAIMRQKRSYAAGDALIAKKEGALLCPTAMHEVKRAAKVAAHVVLKQHVVNPAIVAASVLPIYYGYREQRKLIGPETPAIPSADRVVDFVCPLDVPQIGGRAFSARIGPARWYAANGVEEASVAVLDALLPQGGRMVDCGANVGTFTIASALKVGTAGQVTAFEPDRRTAELLTTNVERHRVGSIVNVREEAVGRLSGTMNFNEYANDVVSGLVECPHDHSGPLVATRTVTVVTLDAAISGSVDFVKIDVEGLEVDLLDGAAGLLARSANVCVLVELNPAALAAAGRSSEELLNRFPVDYWSMWTIQDKRSSDETSSIRELDRAELMRHPPSERWYANVLATPHHRRRAVAAALHRVEARLNSPSAN